MDSFSSTVEVGVGSEERGGERERESVCVCVCVRERERRDEAKEGWRFEGSKVSKVGKVGSRVR